MQINNIKYDNRIYWVDNLKSISLFFVLFAHTRLVNNNLWADYINSFAIAIFIFISGFLFNKSNKSKNKFFKKNFYSLIIPYIFFSFTTYLFWLLIGRHYGEVNNLSINPLDPFIGIFYGSFSTTKMIHNVPLWFLPCLFSTKSIFFLLNLVFKNKAIIFISIFLGITGLILKSNSSFLLPWGIDAAMLLMPFYLAGHILKEKYYLIKINFSIRILISLICIVLIQIIILKCDFQCKLFLTYHLLGFVGIYFWFSISGLFNNNIVCKTISNHSISIFSLNDLSYKLITWVLFYNINLSSSLRDTSYLVGFIYIFFGFIISISISNALRKHMPWSIGFR